MLLKSIVSDRGPQFIAEMMKELNNILGIETKLSMSFHSERMNQKLEQYF